MDNATIRHLLGYLNQEQVNNAIEYCGLDAVREVMDEYGWGQDYEWNDNT